MSLLLSLTLANLLFFAMALPLFLLTRGLLQASLLLLLTEPLLDEPFEVDFLPISLFDILKELPLLNENFFEFPPRAWFEKEEVAMDFF